MKKCVTCHEMKALEEFHLYRASPDGRQPRCRQCTRDHYQENKQRLRAAVDRRISRVQADNRRRLASFLASHPCIDCDEDDLRVLDFDHRVGVDKHRNIAQMLTSSSWAAIEREIAKCDVRCANCHRRRTSERAEWWRQGVHEETVRRVSAQAVARLSRLVVTVRD